MMVSPRRFLSPLVAALVVLAATFAATGCSRSPEERLQSAIDKIETETPPDLWGAITILRGLARDAEVAADVRTEALLQLSRVHVMMQEYDEALALLDDAAALHEPATEQAQGIFALRLQLFGLAGKNAEAAAALRAHLDAPLELPTPRRTALRIQLGAFLARAGEKVAAREVYEALLAEYDDPQVHQAVLDALILTYLPDEPIAAAERYVAYAEAHPDRDLARLARYGAGVLLTQAGEEARARPELEAYFTWAEAEVEAGLDSKEKYESLLRLAHSYKQLARTADEERVLRRGLTLFEAEAGLYSQVAWRMVDPLVDLGRRDEAFAVLRSIAERFPQSEEAKRVPQLMAALEAGLQAFDERQAQEGAALEGVDAAQATPTEAGAEGAAPSADAPAADEPAPAAAEPPATEAAPADGEPAAAEPASAP